MIYTKEKIYEELDKLKIIYDIVEHPPIYTSNEGNKLNLGDNVGKNLFIRDKNKENYFLIVLQKDKKLDFKSLQEKLNIGKLTFTSEEDLYKYLKLTKGTVSPLGILNNDDKNVKVVFDKDLIKFNTIGIHPNDNTATIWINTNDLINLIENHGNNVTYI